jgi:hypothetical protein
MKRKIYQYMIPKTDREVYFEFDPTAFVAICFRINVPFTYRGFELEFNLIWISFGIRWNIPF